MKCEVMNNKRHTNFYVVQQKKLPTSMSHSYFSSSVDNLAEFQYCKKSSHYIDFNTIYRGGLQIDGLIFQACRETTILFMGQLFPESGSDFLATFLITRTLSRRFQSWCIVGLGLIQVQSWYPRADRGVELTPLSWLRCRAAL